MNKKPLIGILESVHQDGINLLKKFSNVYLDTGKSKKEIFKNVKRYDVIFIKSNIKINKEFIENAKNLKIVARAGTGIDNIDLELLKKNKIKFFSTPNLNSKSVAELTIALILLLIKKIPDLNIAISKGDYRRHLFLSKDLSELKVGLVGLGNVGIEVAKRLKPFGCKLYGYDKFSKKKQQFKKLNGTFVNNFKKLLSNSDILSFHVRLNESNKHMFNTQSLKYIKKGIFLINTSRAQVIEEKAVLLGLRKKLILGVGLDILAPEMPYENKTKKKYYHKFLKNKKIYITPHIGSMTESTQRKISFELIKNITKYLNIKNF